MRTVVWDTPTDVGRPYHRGRLVRHRYKCRTLCLGDIVPHTSWASLCYRMGEAKNPGPMVPWTHDASFLVQSIEGDGQCLYGALGASVGISSPAMREQLFAHAPPMS